jgi:hypothetical protein
MAKHPEIREHLASNISSFSKSDLYTFFQGVTVDTVVNSGPGLVFITYPEVVLKLPGGSIWAIIFFFMLVVRPPSPPPLPCESVSDAVCFTGGFTRQTLP